MQNDGWVDSSTSYWGADVRTHLSEGHPCPRLWCSAGCRWSLCGEAGWKSNTFREKTSSHARPCSVGLLFCPRLLAVPVMRWARPLGGLRKSKHSHSMVQLPCQMKYREHNNTNAKPWSSSQQRPASGRAGTVFCFFFFFRCKFNLNQNSLILPISRSLILKKKKERNHNFYLKNVHNSFAFSL